MMTRWGRAIDPEHVLDEYPRPEMVRESYLNLNGVWDYAITESDAFPQKYHGKILVPFSPEAPLSGVNRILQPGEYLHYEKQLTLRKEDHERYLLHSDLANLQSQEDAQRNVCVGSIIYHSV